MDCVLIGIEGLKGYGKDTVADYIVSRYGFEKRAFADPLKKATQILFDFSNAEMKAKDEISQTWGIAPRTIFKDLGTEYLQHHLSELIPGLGVNHAVKRLFLKPYKLLVISDVRFEHEVEEIRRRGGFIIQIDPTCTFEGNKAQRDETHISEDIDRLYYDIRIKNNDSLDSLYDKIEEFVDDILPTEEDEKQIPMVDNAQHSPSFKEGEKQIPKERLEFIIDKDVGMTAKYYNGLNTSSFVIPIDDIIKSKPKDETDNRVSLDRSNNGYKEEYTFKYEQKYIDKIDKVELDIDIDNVLSK
jgi:hypothetical protein